MHALGLLIMAVVGGQRLAEFHAALVVAREERRAGVVSPAEARCRADKELVGPWPRNMKPWYRDKGLCAGVAASAACLAIVVVASF